MYVHIWSLVRPRADLLLLTDGRRGVTECDCAPQADLSLLRAQLNGSASAIRVLTGRLESQRSTPAPHAAVDSPAVPAAPAGSEADPTAEEAAAAPTDCPVDDAGEGDDAAS
eukprot:2351013-Pyramimonas_sp.AAC.1